MANSRAMSKQRVLTENKIRENYRQIKQLLGLFYIGDVIAKPASKLPSFWTEALAVPRILPQKQEVTKTRFLYQAPQLLKIQ